MAAAREEMGSGLLGPLGLRALTQPGSRINLETFTLPKEFVNNPQYDQDRRATLATLDIESIDDPIAAFIADFTILPHSFTLQSCYGHFLYTPEQDVHNLDSLPSDASDTIKYRMAYIVFCIQNSPLGRSFYKSLTRIPAAAPEYIQFGSADWFWMQHHNSYVLQVMPRHLMTKDEVTINHAEAVQVQKCRDLFFIKLIKLLDRQLQKIEAC